jgi:hexosaminidase
LDYGLDGIDTKKVYEFDPIPADLPLNKQNYILGAEGNMWTERAPEAEVTSKIFPRLIALSEVLWTYPKERDAVEFQSRFKRHLPRLDKSKVRYCFMTTPNQFF